MPQSAVQREALVSASPAQIRAASREQGWTGSTGGLAPGYLQANVAIVPAADAVSFLTFAQRNPRPCPVVDILEPGQTEPTLAPGCDIRTDLPRYRVFEHGVAVAEPHDLDAWWRDDLVTVLLGCSATFEHALVGAGIPVHHLTAGSGAAPMYITTRECVPSDRFHGPLVVTMRSIPGDRVSEAILLSAGFPEAHGTPVHVGDPTPLGIDLDRPDFGGPVVVPPGEVPVFWACGVTPQIVAQRSATPLMITHYPGCMLVTDRRSGASA